MEPEGGGMKNCRGPALARLLTHWFAEDHSAVRG